MQCSEREGRRFKKGEWKVTEDMSVSRDVWVNEWRWSWAEGGVIYDNLLPSMVGGVNSVP